METLLSVEEAAQKLKTHPETARKWLRENRLGGVKVGRGWRVRESDLKAFVTAHAQTAVTFQTSTDSDIGTFLTKAGALRIRLRQNGYAGASGAEVVNAARDERTARISGENRE